ncbi:MAG: efflux RND transporter periplasmic adaptor subunit [Chlamydiae bacterium]|nr:efflux RND transporter periplasmic adaptor subunit [Chlamydiota bacterium]MBI3265722.1 efflux RND transporter periplasmic adaptor subunit [Chlamydiota bacterium]
MTFQKKSWFLWGGIPTLLLFFSVGAWVRSFRESVAPELKAVVSRGSIRQVIQGGGTLEADEIKSVQSPLEGTLKNIFVHSGDRIRKGKIIFEIGNDHFKQDLALARAQYDQALLEWKKMKNLPNEAAMLEAKNTLEKAKQVLQETEKEVRDKKDLCEKGFISQKELEDAQNYLSTAKTEKDIAFSRWSEVSKPSSQEDRSLKKAELSKKKMELKNLKAQWKGRRFKSPFKAWVVDISKKVNEEVGREDPILSLVNLEKPFVVKGALYESDVHEVREGEKAWIKMTGSRQRLKAEVTEVSPMAQSVGGGRKFPMKLRVDGKIRGVPRLGVAVDYEIFVQEKQNVLTLPLPFVVHEESQRGAWVLKGGKARFVPLGLGLSDDAKIEVMGGVKEGEEVILPRARVES